MPIEMPKGLPFSVDTWSPKSDLKRHHFLTHAHKDHLAAIASHALFPIYCSSITKSLVLHLFPKIDEDVFVEIQVGKEVVVHDQDGDFTVTAFDANHCPGAVMFLFEGEFGNVFHTGDCRLSDDCLRNLPFKYIAKKKKEKICSLDYLFLDCTFGRCPLDMPSKQSAIQQVINCIWEHPSAPNVYLASDLLGQEDVLIEVCKTFGSKLYVDKNILPECFHVLQLIAPDIVSEDKSSRFQVMEGFPRLYERAAVKLAETHTNMQPEPLFIRPSAQWYAWEETQGPHSPDKSNVAEAVKDEFGIWHVCYSIHSSQDELESSLRVLRPKWVISTTPSCRAMELDYVKKHCYKTRITTDDPIWKLLKPDGGKAVSSKDSKVPEVAVNTETTNGGGTLASVEKAKLGLKEAVISLEVEMDSPSNDVPITLFGRARLGLEEPFYVLEEPKKTLENAASSETDIIVPESKTLGSVEYRKCHSAMAVSGACVTTIPKTGAAVLHEGESSRRHADDVSISNPSKGSFLQEDSHNEFNFENCTEMSVLEKDYPYSSSYKMYSNNFKRIYRSRNVPVPHPLPSLMKLLDASKRTRVRS